MPNAIAKSLSRLSRDRLIDLCISWTKSSKSNPYLASNRNIVETEEEDYLHVAADSRKELSSVYSSLKNDQNQEELLNLSKKDIIDRILDGDWRRGLSHHQLASIDFAKLEEDDASLRWTALKLVPLVQAEHGSDQRHLSKKRRLDPSRCQSIRHYPETTVGIFVQNLKRHISPVIKAHYHVHRIESCQVSIIRLQIQPNIPFAPLSANIPRPGRASVEASRCVYIALPDSCPFVYVSLTGSVHTAAQKGRSKAPGATTDLNTNKKVILEAISKALSRPQQRWSLEPTRLTAKSLKAMCRLRGGGKVGTTGGVFSQLAQPVVKPKLLQTNDDILPGQHTVSPSTSITADQSRDALIESRFGRMTGPDHVSLDRLNIKVENILAGATSKSKKRKRIEDDDNQEVAPIAITLCGSDVFAGLKQLALAHPEYVDMEKLSAAFSGGSQCSVITL